MDKIICVGKNYIEHAKELGDAVPDQPVLFLKPPSVLSQIESGSPLKIPLPLKNGSVHHECEIVLRVARDSGPVNFAQAEGLFDAVTLGLDLTLRDLQSSLKKQGQPWEISKVFPHSAVIGPWIELSAFENYLEAPFSLSIDGVIKQKGHGRDMRFAPAHCLAYASECFPIRKGDLLFTGTPAGVGPLLPGQTVVLRFGPNWNAVVKFATPQSS